jgi:cytochrome b subunit of formate dehydrogenase
MADSVETAGVAAPVAEHIQRHAGIDRLFHWLTALAVLTLMGTGLLPVLGIKFEWVIIHWITGVVLVLLLLFHIVRGLFWQRIRCLWISAGELRSRRGGKYSVAQKLMHHAMTLMVLAAAVTGVLMLAKVDTPFWKRNPYLLSADTWGNIYVIHGIAALSAVTLVMIHIYFGLIPENRMYLRAMIRGWVTRAELLTRHNPDKWPGRKKT